jgi:hypothetical protein
MSLEEICEIAKNKLMGICGTYKDCDGSPIRICQGQSYGKFLRFGGIGNGVQVFIIIFLHKKGSS